MLLRFFGKLFFPVKRLPCFPFCSIYLFIHLFTFVFIYLSISLFIYLSIYPLFCPSKYLTVSLSLYISYSFLSLLPALPLFPSTLSIALLFRTRTYFCLLAFLSISPSLCASLYPSLYVVVFFFYVMHLLQFPLVLPKYFFLSRFPPMFSSFLFFRLQ